MRLNSSIFSVFTRNNFLWLMFPASLLCASCGPNNYYVSRVEIDDALHVLPVGQREVSKPAHGPNYFFFHGAQLIMIDHWGEGASESKRLLYLEETYPEETLERTAKTDEILSGAFGAVFVEKTCFFNRPVQAYYSSVAVRVGSRSDQKIDEIPEQLPNAPAIVPPLTSFSLVRIFGNSIAYTVISANYEADGKLGSLNMGLTNAGELSPGSHTTFQFDGRNADLLKYGIPRRLDRGGITAGRRLKLPPTTQPEVLTVINLHYGFNELLEQEIVRNGLLSSPRFLKPYTTDEERILAPKCDARLGQQLSMGLPTVE